MAESVLRVVFELRRGLRGVKATTWRLDATFGCG
jgi:hypothetical protein